MAMTNFGALTEHQKKVWSKDLWTTARSQSYFGKLLGSDSNSVVQRITELTKTEKGDKAIITLVHDAIGDGVAGDRNLVGNEEALTQAEQVITIDQLRHAHRNTGRMADQRTVIRFRERARDSLSYWLSDRIDQMLFLTMCGVSYTMHPTGIARTDLLSTNVALSQLEFAADVTAPSAGRRARWNASAGTLVFGGATSDIVAGDTVTWEMLVMLKAEAKQRHVRPLRGADGKSYYNVFLSPRAMTDLKLDPDYMQNLRHAQERDKTNPLFTGDVVMVDGLVIHEHEHVYNTSKAASGSKWGSGGTINGACVVLAGAQALGFADLGDPYWDEEGFDYENSQGIAVGKILGLKKPVFPTIYDGMAKEDFGLMVVYVATK